MRTIFLITLIALLASSAFCWADTYPRVFNYKYTIGDKTVNQVMKFKNMTLIYHTETEADILSTYLLLIWGFQDEVEKKTGEEIINRCQVDLVDLKEDDLKTALYFKLQAKDITAMTSYRKSEFGSAYALEVNQKGVKVTIQFQIKFNDPNESGLHALISDIVSKITKVEEMKFLQ